MSILVLATIALCLTMGEGLASVTSWTNPVGGDWFIPGNWSQGVPDLADTADITLNGVYTVTVSAPAQSRILRLGAATGLQTLRIDATPGASLTCTTGVGVAVKISLNGTLIVEGDLTTATGSSTGLTNFGQLVVHASGTVNTQDDNAVNDTTGILSLDGGLLVADTLHNHGSISSTTSTLSEIQGFTRNHFDGAITVESIGFLQTGAITSNGLIDLLLNGTLNLGTNNNLVNNVSGLVRFGSGASLGYMDGVCRLINSGEVRMLADTSSAVDSHGYISVWYEGGSTSSLVRVLAGTLELSDSALFSSDTVYVSAACTLKVAGPALFIGSSTRMSGAGRVHFGGQVSDITATWKESLGIYCTGTNVLPTTVTFDPAGGPPDSLGFLNVGSNFVTFSIPPTTSLILDSLRQGGGTIEGEPSVVAAYEWTQGTLTSNDSGQVTIPPAATLNVYTPGDKTLDSLELIVEGDANLWGAGVFFMNDSARLNIRPTATLDVGPSFMMTGFGDLYNSGQASFDPQSDTIDINVFVWNTPTSRTPGTIDILSAPVIFSADGQNEGGINIADGGELIVTDGFKNAGGTIDVGDGGDIKVEETLTNDANGSIDLVGGSVISGGGDLVNGGTVGMTGSLLLTPGNVTIEPTLYNLGDSGFVDILADTMTLLNGGVNQGVITIAAGAVLKVFGNFTNDPTGIITGSGLLDVSNAVFVNNGTINAGSSPGRLAILGNVTLGPQSVLNMEMTGTIAVSEYDQIQVSGAITFGGTLNLILQGGYYPAMTDTLLLFTYGGYSGDFATVNGLDLGGIFFELNFGPGGCSNYVCSGVSNISPAVAAISDTIELSLETTDTMVVPVCNTGWCPLTYTASLQNLLPASPPWLSLAAEDTTALVLRSRCDSIRVYIDVAGFAEGICTADLVLSNNDPDDGTIVIPITITVTHGPDLWDIGGGANDFANFTAAAVYLNGTTINYEQIFNVYPGTYFESFSLNQISGASASKNITFRAQNPLDHPVLTHAGMSRIVRLNGTDHTIWDRIDFLRQGTLSGAVAIIDTAGSDSNIFRNCTIIGNPTATGTYGIFMRSASGAATTCDGNVFENLNVNGFATGISLGFVTGVVTAQVGNIIRDCLIDNCLTGIALGCQRDARVYGNVISPYYPSGSVRGIHIGQLSGSDTVHVYANQITNIRGYNPIAIDLRSGQGYIRAYNNVISDWSEAIGYYQGIVADQGARCNIAFNSIWMSENPSGTTSGAYGIRVLGSTTQASVYNNLVYSAATSDTSIGLYQTTPSTLNSNYNCFYGTGSFFFFARRNGASYATQAGWNGATLLDYNSIQDVPGITDSLLLTIDGYWTTCDAHATPYSWITSDYFGNSRDPVTPDIGAFEFTGIVDAVDDLVIRRAPGNSLDMRLWWGVVAGAQSYLIYSSNSINVSITPAFLIGASNSNTFLHSGAISPSNTSRYYLVRPSMLSAP